MSLLGWREPLSLNLGGGNCVSDKPVQAASSFSFFTSNPIRVKNMSETPFPSTEIVGMVFLPMLESQIGDISAN